MNKNLKNYLFYFTNKKILGKKMTAKYIRF